MKKSTRFLCAFLSMAAPSMAATIAEWNFGTDIEGWTAAASSALTASGGLMSGTATTNDPQLSVSGLNLTLGVGQTWDQVVFRVRETQDEAPVGTVSIFNPTGLVVNFNGLGTVGVYLYSVPASFTGVDSGDGFFTVSLNVSALPAATTVTSFRFDPIGGAASNSNSETNGNTFEVDFVRITAVPEPSAALLLSIGALGLLRRRR
jgi:hypothetical protein